MPSTGSRRDQDGFACVAREQVSQDDDGGNAMFKSQNVSVAHGKGAGGRGGALHLIRLRCAARIVALSDLDCTPSILIASLELMGDSNPAAT
jgi:hypothetical protein